MEEREGRSLRRYSWGMVVVEMDLEDEEQQDEEGYGEEV